MRSYRSSRSYTAEFARTQRAAARSQKELARQLKERAKLDQLAQDRLAVAQSENQFEVLMSLHKDCAPQVNWIALASALRPAEPPFLATKVRKSWRLQRVSHPADVEESEPELQIDCDHPDRTAFAGVLRTWEKEQALAARVLVGNEDAFIDALAEFSFLDEIAQLGASIELTVHSARQVEIDVRCNDTSVVPSVAKSLTVSGKLSEKQIPRARFQEIYQDHVCSSLLRVAREAFAVLPIDLLLINGHAMVHDSAKGTDSIRPIYSVFLPRSGLAAINFDRLDPSDAIESFPHRGDFKSSRKTGAFQAIEPLRFDAALQLGDASRAQAVSLGALRQQAESMRAALGLLIARGEPESLTS